MLEVSEDHLAAMTTLQEGFRNRPKNTMQSYVKRAQEFCDWCTEMRYPDGITVTGAKLHQFLREKVCNRSYQQDKGKTIGFGTVRAYKTAIIDLYTQQKGMHMNSNEHPGAFPALKNLMAQYRLGTNIHHYQNYID